MVVQIEIHAICYIRQLEPITLHINDNWRFIAVKAFTISIDPLTINVGIPESPLARVAPFVHRVFLASIIGEVPEHFVCFTVSLCGGERPCAKITCKGICMMLIRIGTGSTRTKAKLFRGGNEKNVLLSSCFERFVLPFASRSPAFLMSCAISWNIASLSIGTPWKRIENSIRGSAA